MAAPVGVGTTRMVLYVWSATMLAGVVLLSSLRMGCTQVPRHHDSSCTTKVVATTNTIMKRAARHVRKVCNKIHE